MCVYEPAGRHLLCGIAIDAPIVWYQSVRCSTTSSSYSYRDGVPAAECVMFVAGTPACVSVARGPPGKQQGGTYSANRITQPPPSPGALPFHLTRPGAHDQRARQPIRLGGTRVGVPDVHPWRLIDLRQHQDTSGNCFTPAVAALPQNAALWPS